jgi:hypothetical protein
MNIENSIKEGYKFKFSQYFSEGFEIFKKDMGSFVGYGLVVMIINLLSKFLPLIGYVIGLLLTPLYAGFYVVANKITNGERYEFQSFFEGFNRALEMILASIFKIIISLFFIIPYLIIIFYSVSSKINFNSSFDNFEGIFSIVLLIIPMLLFGFVIFVLLLPFLIWTDLIILFSDKYKAWDSLVLSFKLTLKNYFPILIFATILLLLNIFGAVLFGFGLLFTIPFTYCVFYAAFRDIANLSNDNQSNIDEHLIVDDLV